MHEQNSPVQPYRLTNESQLRNELILNHLPLVKHVLGRLAGELPPHVDLENLESAGVLGLVEAAQKFDPTRNAQFKTFAYFRIRGAILDELRRNCPLPQHMLAKIAHIRRVCRELPPPVTVAALAAATGLSEDEIADILAAERLTKMTSWEEAEENGGIDPVVQEWAEQEECERWELIQKLSNAIEQLPPRERLAVTLYYREDLRLREIAELMQLSLSRVSRLISKAIFELGQILRHEMHSASPTRVNPSHLTPNASATPIRRDLLAVG